MEDFGFGPYRAERFFNQVDVLRALEDGAAARHAAGRPFLSLVHGLHGSGRKATVSEAWHNDPPAFGRYVEVTAEQPNGRPASLSQMLGQALFGLGMAWSELPASDVERADTYQRVAGGKKFMLVIKDVKSAEQVTSLIPRWAPDASVVAISRSRLQGLLPDFVDLLVRELPEKEARELLKECIGPRAGEIPSEVIKQIAELCDGLPLLVRMAAARLRGREHAAEGILRELQESLEGLMATDEANPFAGFLEVSYSGLSRDLQAAYRRLSSLQGPSFSADAAAIVFGTDRDGAERRLEDLRDANLLVFEKDTRRYSVRYRLIREDARRRAYEVDGDDAVRSTTEAVATWYFDQAIARDAVLAARWRVGAEFEQRAPENPGADARSEAARWFGTEWQSLVEYVHATRDQGLHDLTWKLCVVVHKYLHLHGHVDVALDIHQLGVASARVSGNADAVMLLTNQRGAAYIALGRLEEARADFEESLRIAKRYRHKLGEQSALEWLGKIAARADDFDEALWLFDESERVVRTAGKKIPDDQKPRMLALLGLQRARTLVSRGDLGNAAESAAAQIEYFRSIGELDNQAKCLLVMGEAAWGDQALGEAARCYEQAAVLFDADSARRARAGALQKLGEIRAASGDIDGALDVLGTANALYTTLGDKTADKVEERVRELSDDQ